MSRVYSTSRK